MFRRLLYNFHQKISCLITKCNAWASGKVFLTKKGTTLWIAFHRQIEGRKTCSSSLQETAFNKYLLILKNIFMISNFLDKKIILGGKVKFSDPTRPLGYWMTLGSILRLAELVCRPTNRAWRDLGKAVSIVSIIAPRSYNVFELVITITTVFQAAVCSVL